MIILLFLNWFRASIIGFAATFLIMEVCLCNFIVAGNILTFIIINLLNKVIIINYDWMIKIYMHTHYIYNVSINLVYTQGAGKYLPAWNIPYFEKTIFTTCREFCNCFSRNFEGVFKMKKKVLTKLFILKISDFYLFF